MRAINIKKIVVDGQIYDTYCMKIYRFIFIINTLYKYIIFFIVVSCCTSVLNFQKLLCPCLCRVVSCQRVRVHASYVVTINF